jgi:hypothetical protein
MFKCYGVTFALLLLLGIPGLLQAQYPNIRVSHPASTDPEEVTIAINPRNPLNLAAGANLNYYYYSMDGGYTWEEGIMTSSSFGVWGDPSVIFDVYGNLYYAHLSNPPDSVGYWIDRIVVQKSTDGGITWNDGAGIGYNPPKNQDKEWLGTDLTDSPYRGNLYVAWTEFDQIFNPDPNDSSRILFSRSTDRGETWSDPVRLSERGGNCLDSDDTVEGAVPAVGPNGEVYTTWSGPLGLMFDRSTDGGVTFGEDIFVTSQPGGWDFDIPGILRCNGFPITACDISNSQYRGNVYVSWSDQRNGTDDTDVFFITSTDGGETWGDVVRVNDDSGAAHQFFNWMTVDPFTGIIYLVFYDRRSTAGNATEVYGAKSEDGGATFTNFKISESPFTPHQSVFFGDYINIAAWNGTIYPIWAKMDELSGYDLSVWTSVIEEPVGMDFVGSPPINRSFGLSQNYPNPFNPVTTISYQLSQPSRVTLSIFDLKGRLVETLVDGYKNAGDHYVTWRANDIASGIYFYKINAGDISIVKKCLISK